MIGIDGLLPGLIRKIDDGVKRIVNNVKAEKFDVKAASRGIDCNLN